MGVLADFLEVEGRYEHVVDDFLRDELNYIVVKSLGCGRRRPAPAAAPMSMAVRRSWFIPKIRRRSSPSTSTKSANHVTHSDAVVPLKNCIRVLDGFGKSLEVILPKLGNGYIVPDPEVGTKSGAGKSRCVLPARSRASASITLL